MNQNLNQTESVEVRENVVAGIVGAFLFSLAGGVLWFVIYLLGFIAGISGLIGAVCAIKGYSVFAKKESKKGIVISVIIALLVMVLAWYFCLAYDVYVAYQDWYEEGIVDFTVTFFEAVRGAHYFLSEPEIGPAYLGDLGIGLLFCIIGAGSYVVNKLKGTKQNAAMKSIMPTAPKSVESETIEAEKTETETIPTETPAPEHTETETTKVENTEE